MKRIYCESGKGDNNLAWALDSQLRELDLRGRKILIKPNVVDPGVSKACSRPEVIQIVIDSLKRKGVSKILVGDEPAQYVFDMAKEKGKEFDVSKGYRDLGYDRLRGVELVDLLRFPTTSYEAVKNNFETGKAERITVPVRDTRELVIVSLTLPKHHGNYNYSGVSKNMMGLTPGEARRNAFHHSFWATSERLLERENGVGENKFTPEEIEIVKDKLLLDFPKRYCEINKIDLYNPNACAVTRAYNDWLDQKIDTLTLETQLEHIGNAYSLIGLVKHFRKTNPSGIYILDGNTTLTKHEHSGQPEKTDFAIVGTDPALVDLASLEKIGIDVHEVPYLNYFAREQLEVYGNIGTIPKKKTIVPKELFEDENGLIFARCI